MDGSKSMESRVLEIPIRNGFSPANMKAKKIPCTGDAKDFLN
jgi:hypothetical protein